MHVRRPFSEIPHAGETRFVVIALVALGYLLGAQTDAAAEEIPEDPHAMPMVEIPGGTYTLGHPDAAATAKPLHNIELEAFRIDTYEVTAAHFAAFLNSLDIESHSNAPAGGLTPADLSDRGRVLVLQGPAGKGPETYAGLGDGDARIGLENGRFVVTEGYENHPAREVTWFGARAFCEWRGARLPTEAEWEAAAAGGSNRPYPWGEAEPTARRAVFGRASNQTEPVGSRPAGATPRGIHDLAGNAAEWTSTLYRPYPYDADDGREDPDVVGERVTRGGDHVFDSSAGELTTYFRDGFSRSVTEGHRHIGFRCAR
jgi:iron(II)-dependent oxidoreductase